MKHFRMMLSPGEAEERIPLTMTGRDWADLAMLAMAGRIALKQFPDDAECTDSLEQTEYTVIRLQNALAVHRIRTAQAAEAAERAEAAGAPIDMGAELADYERRRQEDAADLDEVAGTLYDETRQERAA